MPNFSEVYVLLSIEGDDEKHQELVGGVELMLPISKFKNSDFVDTLISNILHDLPPTRSSH